MARTFTLGINEAGKGRVTAVDGNDVSGRVNEMRFINGQGTSLCEGLAGQFNTSSFNYTDTNPSQQPIAALAPEIKPDTLGMS